MDFIAIDLDKYDVWEAFRQPVPIREQSYVRTANWSPGEEIDCESDNPNDGCFENDRRPKQKGVGPSLTFFW